MIPHLHGLWQRAFVISVLAKAALGLAQLGSGLFLKLAGIAGIQSLVGRMTVGELRQDPDDPLAGGLLRLAQGLSVSEQTFYAAYLIGHGMLNLGVALALLSGIRGAIPVSIAILSGFIVYQMYRFAVLLDPVMLFLSAVDAVIVYLAFREMRDMDRGKAG